MHRGTSALYARVEERGRVENWRHLHVLSRVQCDLRLRDLPSVLPKRPELNAENTGLGRREEFLSNLASPVPAVLREPGAETSNEPDATQVI